MYIIVANYKTNKNSRNITGYVVWDTCTKSTAMHTIQQVACNVTDYIGVRVTNGLLKLYGYNNNLPVIYITSNLYDYIDYKDCCTVVGKFVEHKKKYYLLVYGNGFCRKVNEIAVLQLIKEHKLTNTVNSTLMVKLKAGSIPVYTTKRHTATTKDTVVKIVDISNVSDGGSPGIAPKFIGELIKTGEIGVVKRTVSSKKYDNINETLCYELGCLLGVKVCKAQPVVYRQADDWLLSVFEYDYNKKNSHFRSAKQVFGTEHFVERFTISNIEKMFGTAVVQDFQRMLLFDLITRQTDRHISNFAFYDKGFYPLYDNGRCLFWDETDLTAINDDIFSSFVVNEHGYGYAYIDTLGVQYCRTLLNTAVTFEQFKTLLYKHYGETERAALLAKYIFTVYKLLIGGAIDVR